MTTPRAKIIVNPAAGRNSTHRKWRRISRLLKHLGFLFDHEYTEGIGHAVELAKAAAVRGYEYLVAVGGDGTVHEVANGILDTTEDGSVSLGVVSTGTGGDFIRSLGIPKNYISACSSLTGPGRQTIDVGIVEYGSNGSRAQRYFVNGAGIGFDAAVVKTVGDIPKYIGGTVPYLFGLTRTLAGYRNKNITLSVGDDTESSRVLSVVIANGRYFGGGMEVAPEALLDDSLFNVTVIGDVGKFDLVKSVPMLYNGTIARHPKVSMMTAEEVTITSKDELLVQADGELLGKGPASFRMIPAALSMVV